MDRATRDRFGEIVFRFFFGSLYRNGHFSGDPHPGNYRLMSDGRVAFMDFGMTKRVAREDVDAEVAAFRAGMDGDAGRAAPPARGDGVLRPRRRAGHARGGVRPLPRVTALVHRGPRGHDRPRAGGAGADRLRRPALASLGADEARDDAAAGDAGAAHGGADAGRARAARGHRQLAPDRARVAVRRPGLDRARRGRRSPSTCARRHEHLADRRVSRPRGAAAGRPGDGGADRPLRGSRRRAGPSRPAPGRRLRRAGAGHRRAAALDQGRPQHLRAADRALRRPHPHAAGAARHRSRRAARRRALGRQGGLSARSGRARRGRRTGPRAPSRAARRGGDRAAGAGQGARPVDRRHVPALPPGPARRAAGGRPRHQAGACRPSTAWRSCRTRPSSSGSPSPGGRTARWRASTSGARWTTGRRAGARRRRRSWALPPPRGRTSRSRRRRPRWGW